MAAPTFQIWRFFKFTYLLSDGHPSFSHRGD